MRRDPLAIAALLLAATTAALALSELATLRGGNAVHSTPAFLTRELGAARPSAPLVGAPAKNVVATFGRGGVAVRKEGVRIGLTAAVAGGAWTRHEHGVSRNTPFGVETITASSRHVEESLVVAKHQGLRTWRWQLHLGSLVPQLDVNGGVSFADRGKVIPDLEIGKPVLYDSHGHDVTPANAHWVLRGTTLELRIDDHELPSRYVIDPVINVSGACGAAANGASLAGCTTRGSTTGTATTLNAVIPSTVAVGNILVAQVSVANTSTITATTGGWTKINQQNDGGAAGTQAVFYKIAAATDTAGSNVGFSWTAGGYAEANMLVYTGVNNSSPLDGATGVTASGNAGSASIALTTSGANQMDVAFVATPTKTSFTCGGVGTEEYHSRLSNSTAEESDCAGDLLQATAGASGSFTASGGTPWSAIAVSLKPMPDGAGTMALQTITGNATSHVSASQTGRTLVFRYTVASTGSFGGTVTLAVPAGWTAPTTSNAAGCVSSTAGAVSAAGQTITVSGLTLAAGATVDITYGATSGGSCAAGDTATATSSVGAATWQVQEQSTAAGTLTNIGASPTVTVNAADGSGAMVLTSVNGQTTTSVSASSAVKMVFTYTAPAGGIDTATVKLTVPAGWTAPQTTTSNAAGYTTSSTGVASTAAQVITVTGVTLSAGSTFTVTYGDTSISAGGAATATSTTGGPTTWTLQEASTQYGTVTNVAGASSPAVTVFGLDGAGTVTAAPANVANGTSGQSIAFTFTAPSGGTSGGEVDVVVPAGWTAPTAANAAGCVSASTGSVSVSGTTIKWTGITLAAAGTATVTYGATSGGACTAGDTATSSSTAGTSTFTTKEMSTPGGLLTAIAANPSVNVYSADGAGTGTVSPTSTLAGTTNNTEVATYTVATGGVGASGVVELTVPANWTAPQKTTSNAAGYVTATSGGSAVAAANIAIAGSGPWTIDVTLPSALASGQTVAITYGDTSGSASGAAAAPGAANAGNSVFTVKAKSTSGGTLTTVGVGGGTQTVAVNTSADGSGTGTISPTSALAGTTGNTETATYTAATGGVAANGVVELTVPASWTAPQKTTSNAAGYVTATSGGSAVAAANIAIAGTGPWTVDITVPSALGSGQTVVVTYGDTSVNAGGAATAPGTIGNYTFTVKEKSTSGGALTTVGVGGGTQTVAVGNAADGSGTGTISPTSTLAGTTSNTETATYTVAAGGVAASGVVELTVPANWSAPQKTTSNAAGYVTATSGGSPVAAANIAIAGSGPWTIDVTLPAALASGQTVVIKYGDTSVNAGGAATAPGAANAGNSVFTVKEKSTSGGTLTTVGVGGGTQTVAVNNSADGAGTGTVAPTSTFAGTSSNTEVATYTATTGGLAANGVVELTIPANWSAPQKTTSNAAGYVTATSGGSAVAAGNIAIAGSGPWTIDITVPSALNSGQTVVVTYGDTSINAGGAAAAPSAANAGNSVFTIKEKSKSGGTLTTVGVGGGTQTVSVSNSADGAGTGAILPVSTLAGTTNNTETATYTATTGGLAANGVVQLTVPANWSAPQKTTSNAAGYVTATAGGSPVAASNIAIAGSGPWTIDITLPAALNSGQTVVIAYGDTSVSAGAGAAAPSAANAGNYTFTVKAKSTSGGVLTTVAVGGGSQTVAVVNSADGAGTGAVLPASTFAGTANNTETATYTVATGGVAANGVVELTVPANWSAPQKTTSNAAGYVTATSGGSAVAAGNIAIAGSGPWTIDITVPSALNSGQTVVVTYGDTSINAGGAATTPSAAQAGSATFTIKERSTSGGTLATVAGTQTVTVSNSADGAGTGAVLPTSTLAGTTNNTETATYTATTGGLAANGDVQLTVPANWSAPQKTTSNAAGYVTATSGGSAVAAGNIAIAGSGPWTIDITVPSALNSGQTVVIKYGDTSVNAGGAATAPGAANAGNSVFTIKEKSTSGGTLTTVAVGGGTQTVAVSNSADGAGTGAVLPTSTPAGTTNNTISGIYSVTTGGVAANGVVELTVPANWSAPQKTTSNAAGYVTATAGGSAVPAANIAVSGGGPWTIDVTVPSALNSGQSVVISYGDTSVSALGAATAPGPGQAGNYTFTIKEKSTSGGTLTTVGVGGGTQTIAVNTSADGSGSVALGVTSVLAGTTTTEAATYTVAAGGMAANGVVELSIPAGWSAPQKAVANNAGFVTAAANGSIVAAANIAIAGSGPWTIDVTVPSALSSGQTVVITYGDTGSGINPGGAAAVPGAGSTGNYTFATKEKSTSGGSLQSVAGTSTVSVTSSGDGTGTGAIVPTSTLAATTNNTETATYTATTGGVAANGVVQLTVPANWTAPQKTTSNAAGYVTATSGGSAVAAGNIAIAGTGPWTISVTVPSALASGQTVVITYGDTSSSPAGAVTAPGPSQAGNYTFTVKEKSTSGGTLTTVGAGGGTQTVAVGNSADGTGTGTVAPSSTLAGTATNTETATYTVAAGGVAAGGGVELTVPANWTPPQTTTSNAAGYVTATANGSAVAAGNISISGTGPWTVDVTVPSALATGQTVVIFYGDTSVSSAGAATAPGAANAGSSVFTIKERSTSGGTLTAVGGSQTVAVNTSADGAGTLARTSALNVERGSGGNTVSFTFTAAAGGLENGAFTIAVPAGWSTPSTIPSANGYTTSDAGTVSAAGSLITIGNLTLDGGQTVHVEYGSTVGGGSGADAPSAYGTGDQTWRAQERSTAGGALTDLASSPIVHVRDSVAPTVSGVSATDANGAYAAGQVLHLAVTFSEPVTVTGTPQLLVETGLTDESASYASGSGTSTLEFDYTVQAGDTSSDLDAHDANALTLNGGTILDAEGNAAVRTLTVGAGNAGALANAKDLVVDTTSPGASVTMPAADGLSYNGSSLPAAISGSSSDAGGSGVTSVGVAIRDGSGNYWGGSDFDQGSLTYNATGGTAGSWTYSTTTLAGKLSDGHTYTITVRATDAAGNTGTTTRTFGYDASPPTVTNVTATNADGAYAVGATIHVQVSFSEPVAVTGTPKLSLNVGRTADYVSGSGTSTLAFDYTVQAGDDAATLDYSGTGSLSGGTITDTATNAADETLAPPGAAGSLGAGKSIQIDTTAPTVSSVSASDADGAYRAGQTIHVQATFAEPVNVTGTPTLALNDGRSASFAGGSGTGTLTFDYTVQAGDTSSDLDYAATSSLALNGGTIADPAGNAATLALPTVGGASSLGGQKNIVVDTTDPAEAVAIPFVDGSTYNGSSLPGSISGSSSDAGGSGVTSVGVAIRDGSGNYWGGSDFDQGSLTYNATGGTAGSWTYSTTTLAGKLTDGHTYTITVRATDAAGNAGTATRTFVFDSSAPTVTGVTASNANGSYGAGTTIHVQVSFSEPVVVSGQPVLSLTDGEDALYASGSGTSTLTFDDVVQSGDDVAVLDYTGSSALTAGTIDDAATNDALRTLASPGAAGSLSSAKSIRIDTTDPTESVDTPGVDGSSYDAASLPSSIAGSANDAGGSGVATIQIAIRDGSGNYWGGSDFDQPSLTFNASGGAPASWTYSTATLVTKLLDGHTYTIVARATDNAGNTSTSNRTFVYDTAAPTVTSVTATNADGAYTTGEVVHVRISFDEAVDVTGSPKLGLNTSPAESATYASGSGTATLTFDYTVQAGDAAADLDYATTGSLTLNGGTIEDAATNGATLTLPAVGGPSSLGEQKAIVIDTASPTVTAVTATNADGSYGAGQTIHLRLTFSKAVTVAGGTPTLALSTSPARFATYASGSGTAILGFDYTVQAGDTASRLDAAAANALHLNGATIHDLAANDAVTTVPTGAGTTGALANAKNIDIDTTAPTVTNVTSAPTTGSYKAGQTVHVTVTFSEPVDVTGTPSLSLNDGGTASYATGTGGTDLVFDYVVGAGENVSPLAYSGTGALTLNSGTIRDAAANAATTTLPSPGAAGSLDANTTLTIDTTAPTVTGITATNANGPYSAGDVIHVQVAFGEPVDVTGTPSLDLNNGASADYVSGSGSATLAFDYTVQPGDDVARLDAASASALSGTIRDGAANDATLTVATGQATSGALANAKNLRIDTTGPAAAVATPASDGTTYNSSSLPASIAGSSADGGGSGVATVGIAIQDGSGNYWNGSSFSSGSAVYNASGGTPASWTYSTSTLVGLLADGHTYTISARATDLAGNQTTVTRTFVFDVSAPTVTNVTSTNANGAYKAGDVIDVRVTFSKTVTVSGTPKLALNDGATASYVSGSGTAILSLQTTVQAGENAATLDEAATSALSLNGGAIRDAATNDAALTLPAPGAAGSLGANKSIRVDTTAPSVSSVSASNADGGYTTGALIHVTVSFGENVTVTGTPKLTLGTTPARTADFAGGSGSSTLTFDYTVQAGDTAADLDYASTGALALNGGTIDDVASNAAVLTLPAVGGPASLGGQKSIEIDTTAPAVTSRSVSDSTLDIAYGEPVAGSPAPSDFAVLVNGAPDAVDSVAISGGNTVQLALHTAVRHLDVVAVTYSGSSVADAAGNAAATFTGAAAPNSTADVAPNPPVPSGPPDGAFVGTATPTLSAVFDDPDSQDTGKVVFEVCANSACSSSLGTVDSSSTTLAVGQLGSASVPGSFGLQTATQYWWRAKDIDSSSTASSFGAARTFTVDTTAPSVQASAAPGTNSGFQFYDGTSNTLWLNATQLGTFTLNATASDAQSGIAGVDFPAILGNGASTDTSNPYSASYSFDGTGTPLASPGSETITARNGVTVPAAGSASDHVSILADSAAPATFALGSPADGTKVRDGVTLSAVPTDADSGLRSVDFLFCDRTANALCVPSTQIGTTQTVPILGVYSVAWSNTALTDGHDYAIAAVATDNVGHTRSSTISTLLVDNSDPSVAVSAPSPVTGAQYQSYDAGSKTLWLNAGQSGSFTLEAAASDPDSGIAGVTFPALLGTAANPGTHTSGSSYESSTYSFSSPVSQGSRSISATNGVTLPSAGSASDSLTVSADGTAPSTIVEFPLDNGSYDSTTWPGSPATCSPAGICGTVADGGSGVASVKISIEDRTTGKYFDGTGFTQSTQAPFLTATLSGATSWHYDLDASRLTSPHAYEVEAFAVDNVGNAESHTQIRFTYGSDTGAPATTLRLAAGASHAALAVTGPHAYNLYYGTTTGGGGFTLHADSTDPSGVDTIAFPSLTATGGFGGSGGTSTNSSNADPYSVDSPAYTFSSGATTAPAPKDVVSTDLRGNSTPHDTLTFILDNTAPAGGSISVGPVDANGYATTTSLTVSHLDYSETSGSGLASSVLLVASSALSNGSCGGFGSDAPAADGAFTAADGTCYRFTLTGTDKVGNVASVVQIVKVDATAPSQPAISFSGLSSGDTYDNGAGTLFYRPSAGGTFTVNANGSTDAESGIKAGNAGYSFSPLSGFAGSTQTGNALGVQFDGSSTGSGSLTVHATNNAGLASGNASYTLTPDSAAPTGGSLTVNSIAATGGGTSSYLTSGGSVAIATTPYGDGGGSGVQSEILTVQSAALANDACGGYGSPSTISGASYGVSTGSCYRFTLTATDRVGNATSVTTTVKVDTTAPVAPAVSFSNLSAANTFASGTTLFYRPSAGGTFTVDATGASDPETGIKTGNAGYTFSSLGGFASATQTANNVDVTFDGTSNGSGAQTVVATNNAGIASSAAAFTVTPDSGAPTGGLLSISPYSGSQTVTIAKTDFADALSGIASNVLTRSAPLAPSGGSCPASGYTGSTVVATSDTVPTDGACYEYTLTGTDHVGNTATSVTRVLVDTSGPTGGSISYVDGMTSLGSVAVDWSSGTDAESGIANVEVQRATAPLSGSTCGSLGGFTTLVASAATSPTVDAAVSAGNCYAYRIVVTNNAGVTSTFGAAAVAKLTVASPITVSAGNPSGVYLSGTTLFVGPNAANLPFKLELTALGQNGVDSATWQGKASGSLTSAPGTDTTDTTAPFHSGTYTWDGTPGLNDSIQVTRNPGASVDSVSVVSDTNNPTGSVSYGAGPYLSHSIHVTTSASDGESGVASVVVERSQTTLAGSTCGAGWSSYTPVALVSGNDTTVADSTCYRYEVLITDNVGNQTIIASATVAQVPDTTPPSFLSAATNAAGTQLAITMSETLEAAATTQPSAFTVTYNGVVQPSPTGISVAGQIVTLTLSAPPDDSQTVKVAYARPAASAERVRDTASPTENESPSFGPVAVVNNTPDTVAPTVASGSVDTGTITLVFSEPLAGVAPDPTAFDVTTGVTTRVVTSVSTSGSTVTLGISPSVTSADTVVVAYATPASNALHDAAANEVAPFTRSVANQTPVVTPPGAGGGSSSLAPSLVASSPDDGSTVREVATIGLQANQPVTWTHMTLTLPNGSVVALADASGQNASWPLPSTGEGLYVVHGSASAGGRSTDVLTHFTVFAGSANGSLSVPPVQKNAVPFAAGELASSDGSATIYWPAGVFSDSVVVQVAPVASLQGMPAGAEIVDVTAFIRSTHAPVTDLGGILDIRFANTSAGSHVATSQDAKTWRDIPQLRTLVLPDGQDDGWFRDSDGTVHVLTRHLTYYALLGQDLSTTLAMRIVTVRRLWLHNRTFVGVRLAITAPARVTGVFVAPDGSVVPGLAIKTPTRHAGVTILRVPLTISKPGLYKLQLHAEGIGQTTDRTAKIRFVARRPASPVWQDGALRVAVVHGAGGLGSLGTSLGSRFVVERVTDAALYDAVDTNYRTAAVAVVVDLRTVPLSTLAHLHALLPEVQIVGLAAPGANPGVYRALGVGAVLPRDASAATVAKTIRRLVG